MSSNSYILKTSLRPISTSKKKAFIKGDNLSSNSNSNMKFSGAKALPLFVFMLVMTGLVEQGVGSPCGSSFFSSLVQLIPCRAAVTPFSPIPPSDACCNALKGLGQPCLCVLVNGPPISGVDRSMALQLPDKCTANFEPCEIMK